MKATVGGAADCCVGGAPNPSVQGDLQGPWRGRSVTHQQSLGPAVG